ncbi:mechanosensitive ion channel domain-containing protein [Methylopila sp. M107]|uniref:mechanosensitive ion channel domain-containing protein n=1 Tax=Methylopila sp. M107 TaxID=1101190 RepID=UPI0003660AB0|nr:mechanosensitive ion channel domain-containing protein [Methylopila sp. M107]
MLRPFRFAVLALAIVLSAAVAPAFAQEAASPPEKVVQTQPGGDVDALVRILQDDKARAALIERLKGAAAPAPEKSVESAKTESAKTGGDGPTAAPTEAAAVDAAKSAEGAAEPTFARRAAEYTRAVAERAAALSAASVTVVGDLASIVTGAEGGEGFDWGRLIAVAATIGVTFAVFLGLRALGIPFYRWIGRRAASAHLGGRVLLVIASVVVDALMIVIAWGAGYAFALQFGESGVMSIQQTLYLNAFFAVELAKVALRALFSPAQPPLRALPIEDDAANYWYFWGSRIVSTLGYTFLFVAPIVAAAVSPAAAQALRIVVAFATLMMAVAIVLQNRSRVRARLAQKTEVTKSDALSTFYAFLARFWHFAALIWLVALFVVWLANPTEALPFMARATAQTLAAMALGTVLTAFISRLISGGLHVPDNVKARLPLLERRLNAFIPAILKVVRIVVLALVLLVVAQSWALFDFLGWLGTEVGARVATSALLAGLIVVIGLSVFVGMSSWVEYRLNPEFGHVPNAREKTLLTLFRNAFTIALVILVAMMALAQLGVNIAPLLAGAGVLGLAIGFGAQSLVKDIITGLFIQLENAMNTGDNVTVAGVTGTVENLTIRSVGIRSLNGTYHLIPFSSVESVSNNTKIFSYHMVEMGVAYRESIPDVRQAMQDAFDRLKETAHGAAIIAPFEIQGLTVFGDSAITVRGRIKTEPGKQWAVGRAYNEIVKEIFDERGIEMPFPHVTIYMGEDRDGKAPPLRVAGDGKAPLLAVESARPAAAPSARPQATRASDRVETLDGPADEAS